MGRVGPVYRNYAILAERPLGWELMTRSSAGKKQEKGCSYLPDMFNSTLNGKLRS